MFIEWKRKQNIQLTVSNLELEIEAWIQSTTNSITSFNSSQALEFLRQLGIRSINIASILCLFLCFSRTFLGIITSSSHLQALSFKDVIPLLPQVSRTLNEKKDDWDLIEGYDKKYFEMDWKTVRQDDQLLRKSGWH